jgi:hypothetical protein
LEAFITGAKPVARLRALMHLEPKPEVHDMAIRVPKDCHAWLVDEAHRIRKATGHPCSPTRLAEEIVKAYIAERLKPGTPE